MIASSSIPSWRQRTAVYAFLAFGTVVARAGEEPATNGVFFDYPRNQTILEARRSAGLGGPQHGGPFFTLAGNGSLHFRSERDVTGRVVARLEPHETRQLLRFALNSGLAEAKQVAPTYGITDVGSTVLSVTLSSYRSKTRTESQLFKVAHSVVAPEWRLAYEPNNRQVAAIGAIWNAFMQAKELGRYVPPRYSGRFLESHDATYWDDPPGPWRGMHEGRFKSFALPQLEVGISSGFEYVGASRFELRETALVERHHWVSQNAGRIEALLVLQFEGLLSGVDGRYRYSIPDGDELAGSNFRFSSDPILLGGLEFIHNTWAFDWTQQVADHPDAEVGHTDRLLREHGLELTGPVGMSRFVRVVDKSGRQELIIFYIEALPSLDPYPDGQPPSSTYDELSARITAASLRAVEVLELR